MEIIKYSEIFRQSIDDYHRFDDVEKSIDNPYPIGSHEHLTYLKNWVDTVQWHLEDIIRNPQITPEEALVIKRKIDASNQHRTDLVEHMDSWFLNQFKDIRIEANATFNTESPAWALDRLSILELKIYHMRVEAERESASVAHRENCSEKLNILLAQRDGLCTAIEQLLRDLATGKKYMKVYKQMKMYNDENLNPALYQPKKK